MRNFMKVCDGINVSQIALQLKQKPHLWDQNKQRKEKSDSPHTAMSDIWIRYNDDTEAKASGDYSNFNKMHYPVWYPVISELPEIRNIAMALMGKMGATHLGGVLITKIPAGGHIKPHIDGDWHAKFYNCKLYIPLQSNAKCINRCEDEYVVMRDGECWYFNNLVEHEVMNNGDDDRMTLIVCMRVE
ncbi:MAG: aspartyl/asparaginyl beta-hydroxylase domain-containing protein [Pseudomonadota bacterium]